MSQIKNALPKLDFRGDTTATVGRVQDSLAQVITRIPGFTYRRPNDLALELGIDAKLAWRIGRCIEDPDPFVAAQMIPGPAGIKSFLRAVTQKQVPSEQIEAVKKSVGQFSELVRKHAGSRKNFDMLATSVGETKSIRLHVEQRRKAFEGNSYVWGVHARTIFRCNIVQPSPGGKRIDFVTVRGYVDFCCTRLNVAWRMARPFSVDDKHTMHTSMSYQPVEPDAENGGEGPPLLREFCSQPLPQFRSVVGPLGQHEFEFVAASVGNTARHTCITGEILRQVEPRYKTDAYLKFAHTFPIRLPAEVLIFDVLMHKDLFDDDKPLEAELYSDLFGGGPGLRYEDVDLLPFPESLESLGTGLDVARTRDIPSYKEMLQYALDRAGWSGDQFEVHRLRLRYPPIPATAKIFRMLPEA